MEGGDGALSRENSRCKGPALRREEGQPAPRVLPAEVSRGLGAEAATTALPGRVSACCIL